MIMQRYSRLCGLAAAILAVSVSTVSCMKDDDALSYNNQSMVSVIGTRYVSDMGSIFNVVENKSGQEPSQEATRMLFITDVLNNTSNGKENEFDVRLTGFVEAVEKEVIIKGNQSTYSEELVGNDPVSYRNPFFSGGYINFFFTIEAKKGSQVEHYVNIVLDEERSVPGHVFFELKHNANGETIAQYPSSDLVLREGLMSCYIRDILLNYQIAGQSKVDVTFESQWYEGDKPSAEASIVTKTIEGPFDMNQYYHNHTVRHLSSTRSCEFWTPGLYNINISSRF